MKKNKTEMKVSKLWDQLVQNQFVKIDEKFLADFRETEKANNRLAAWDPFDRSMRYYKFLLFHHLQTKDDRFFENYKKIGNTELGNPVTISIHPGSNINLDHFFSIEEYTFLNCSMDLNSLNQVIEIGAGFGRTAQALIKLVKNISKYIIIDIPEVLSLSSSYLKKVLSKEEYQKLTFVNAYSLDEDFCGYESTDLVINIDSFQEMPQETIMYYFDRLINTSRFFYTKNAIGKYKPELVGLYDVSSNQLQDVFSLGLSTDVIDIFNANDLQKTRIKHVEQYRPTDSHIVISQEPLGIFPYYHNVLYGKDKD